jgi:hypothetical protein
VDEATKIPAGQLKFDHRKRCIGPSAGLDQLIDPGLVSGLGTGFVITSDMRSGVSAWARRSHFSSTPSCSSYFGQNNMTPPQMARRLAFA